MPGTSERSLCHHRCPPIDETILSSCQSLGTVTGTDPGTDGHQDRLWWHKLAAGSPGSLHDLPSADAEPTKYAENRAGAAPRTPHAPACTRHQWLRWAATARSATSDGTSANLRNRVCPGTRPHRRE